MIADWMREAFECHNPVIRTDDFLKPQSELKRLSKYAANRRTSTSALANSLQGFQDTPQGVNLPALETAIKVARQTWAGDKFIFVEGVHLLADEDLAELVDVKIFLRASNNTCRARYSGDLRFFDEFAWPLFEQFNEGFLGGTHPSMAVAFHVIDGDAPLESIFESVHRTLTRY